MEVELIAYVRAERTEFIIKDYICEDNILTLIESGSFVYSSGSNISKNAASLEAVVFKSGNRYIREITSPACLHLFRYRCDEKIFADDHIIFQDKKRISSTIEMLNVLYKNTYPNNSEPQKILFADLINLYKFESSCIQTKETMSDTAVSMALDFFDEHFCERINLTDVSDYVNLSYVQFSRRFKKAMGITPFEYIAGLRLKKAQHLLLNTNLVLSQIAPMCGFDNEYYFSNFFKNHTKMSPTAFRHRV